MRRIFLALYLLFVTCFAHAQADSEEASLSGLERIHVSVYLPEQFPDRTEVASNLFERIVSKLSEIGVGAANPNYPLPEDAYMYLQFETTSSRRAFLMTLGLMQRVTMDRSKQKLALTTWSSTRYGVNASTGGDLMQITEALVEKFITDYLKANAN